ncbi:hypothetical protein COK06_28865 [Bacillus cereus]|nr:hypothetical protein CON40_10055 [Bacillus cereus]PET92559.1 hypothetical protein CN527_30530 [Bacillus cereus]PEW01670.1 hypothetical protein CN428_14575 [Bacillus cereus]PEZ87200.1 hypothetical protein CN374_18035 [Bacillus cereus]PFA35382.1 hypothetical protein CN390_04925 [Bacillus cereus]
MLSHLLFFILNKKISLVLLAVEINKFHVSYLIIKKKNSVILGFYVIQLSLFSIMDRTVKKEAVSILKLRDLYDEPYIIIIYAMKPISKKE